MFIYMVAIAAAVLASKAQACYEDSQIFRRDSAEAHWGYTGFNGPLNWHGIDLEKNSLCSMGKMQTPINLDAHVVLENGAGYVMTIPGKTATVENRGHTIEVNHIENGRLVFDNKTYNLAQFHFHTPSEHRIDDEFFPMEVHFVHKTAGEFEFGRFLINS